MESFSAMAGQVIPFRADMPSDGAAKLGSVLVVEDDVLVRLMIADELRARGFTVVEAQNADEAIILLQSRVPVGLMITDVQLSGSMDGLALAKLVRETRPKLKILIASGNVPVVGMELADAFFRKPYALDAVVKSVESLLGDILV